MGRNGYDTARLVDLEREDGWAPIRKTFGIESFGINAWTAHDAGSVLVPEHDERPSGHEELYVVISGCATFTVDGDEIDAQPGTMVFVRDPELSRAALAGAAGTTVISVGGRPGQAYQPRSWESTRDVVALLDAGDAAAAKEVLIDALGRYGDRGVTLYNLACAEAQLGETDAAFAHLRDAINEEPSLGKGVSEDSDLEPLRGDPRFAQLTGGPQF